ncbi:hypothetical protein M413DRAFT_368643 [Hebeloma cylindrosporum]|uniref:Putative lipoate-protein ligase A n=1 Tax=Hebeloma cylindrosporum TaxID=76867 RepID=A0A0C2Y248_HEBCY|nr:hypothetical protein M413DRAFT_368643 [Hebeloma cylindrosporum h7]
MRQWQTGRRVLTRLQPQNARLGIIHSLASHSRHKQSFQTLSTVSQTLEHKGLNESLTPEHAIYVSSSTDPLFNLTLEDWLFRNAPRSSPLLLIYRDSPCVIIGRNQNPWTEVNFPALRAVGTSFVRRRSGGGTVYHDLGNTNFSIHLPQSSFDRRATGNVILGAVRSLGIDAQLNDRNDICVGPYKISYPSRFFVISQSSRGPTRTENRRSSTHLSHCFTQNHLSPLPPVLMFVCSNYVSGSAYKIANKRSYHHGTMLISTKLNDLGELLRPQESNIVTKGVSSVRSPVSNLQLSNPSTTHETFTSAVVDAFRKEYRVHSGICMVEDTEDIKNMEYIRNGMAELSTWEWAFGQTPEFSRTLNKTFPWGEVSVEIRSKHGIILDCALEFKNAQINSTTTIQVAKKCKSFCVGQRYGFLREAPEDTQDTGFSEYPTSGSRPAEWVVPTQDTKSWLLGTLQ